MYIMFLLSKKIVTVWHDSIWAEGGI